MKKRINIPDCKTCEPRQYSLFKDLNREELENISENKGCNFYKKGQFIFYEGNHPTGLYCLHQGKVKVFKTGEIGKEQIVRMAKDGNLLGYRALISGEPYRASAETLEDSTICFIPKEILFNLIKSNTSFSMSLMQFVCHELGKAENRMLKIAQKPVRERLAEILLLLKETYGLENDNQTLAIGLSREDLANIVGTATETVIRLLSEFKQEKLISMNGRKIRLLSINGLIKVGKVYD